MIGEKRKGRERPTARIIMNQAGYVRADCTDGFTYFVAIERRRRRRVVTLGRWPAGSRDPEVRVTWRDLPHAIRAIFRDSLPIHQGA